jgi:hypothetical protein
VKVLLLHDIFTDLLIAFKAHDVVLRFLRSAEQLKVMPGLVTRNFALTVETLKEWDIDTARLVICAPFNKVGFQMNPSKEACEKALHSIEGNIIAMSVLAGGYFAPTEALGYLEKLPNIGSIVAGASTIKQAQDTFTTLNKFHPLVHSEWN